MWVPVWQPSFNINFVYYIDIGFRELESNG
jgi:hypothetical protein